MGGPCCPAASEDSPTMESIGGRRDHPAPAPRLRQVLEPIDARERFRRARHPAVHVWGATSLRLIGSSRCPTTFDGTWWPRAFRRRGSRSSTTGSDRGAGPPGDRGTVRAALGVDPPTLVLVTVARLDPVKDFATLLRATRRAQRQLDQIVLVIIGDGPERETLERETSALPGRGPAIWMSCRYTWSEVRPSDWHRGSQLRALVVQPG